MGYALTALALAVLVVAVYPPARTAVVTPVLLQLPRVLGAPIEQELGFTKSARDGVRIAYASTGEGPVIASFLGWATHVQEGFGSTLYDPDGLVPLSSRRNRFVGFDGRGFGLSDRGVKDYSLDAKVSDLAAVIDQLGVEQIGLQRVLLGRAHRDRVCRALSGACLSAGPRCDVRDGWLGLRGAARIRPSPCPADRVELG